MTTKELDQILEPHTPAGVLYNLHKVRGLPFWRLRVYNTAEWEERGVLASYLEMQLSAAQTEAALRADFQWACRKQRAYDWQKAAAAQREAVVAGAESAAVHPWYSRRCRRPE